MSKTAVLALKVWGQSGLDSSIRSPLDDYLGLLKSSDPAVNKDDLIYIYERLARMVKNLEIEGAGCSFFENIGTVQIYLLRQGKFTMALSYHKESRVLGMLSFGLTERIEADTEAIVRRCKELMTDVLIE